MGRDTGRMTCNSGHRDWSHLGLQATTEVRKSQRRMVHLCLQTEHAPADTLVLELRQRTHFYCLNHLICGNL